jgi:arylsulfatase
MGYDAVRAARLERMKSLGIIRQDTVPYPRYPSIPPWESLSAQVKQVLARRMEIYAAMVENMDFHIGRVLSYLRETGQFDNTVVVFFSDNGAAADNPLNTGFDNRLENWGRQHSFVYLGAAWAQVSTTPFRLFKGFQAEGGIRAPLLISGPGIVARDEVSRELLHVTDLAPTFLEIAGVAPPATYRGQRVIAMQGRSLLPYLSGKAPAVRGPDDWIGGELRGYEYLRVNRMIRQGDWKLFRLNAPLGSGQWELYHLAEDPAELNDLAQQRPEKMQELAARWREYVARNGILLLDAPEQ